jgi:hypothetical protein
MSINLSGIPDLTLMLTTISVVVCPMLCGLMAYQVSRTYQTPRNAD